MKCLFQNSRPISVELVYIKVNLLFNLFVFKILKVIIHFIEQFVKILRTEFKNFFLKTSNSVDGKH